MKKPFSIAIAEDQTILREGLNALLSSKLDSKVVGEGADGLAGIRSAQNHSPDLVLMDLSVPRRKGLAVFLSFGQSIQRISAFQYGQSPIICNIANSGRRKPTGVISVAPKL
jgi:DNA-binding NarL/FixJ family response regulator